MQQPYTFRIFVAHFAYFQKNDEVEQQEVITKIIKLYSDYRYL